MCGICGWQLQPGCKRDKRQLEAMSAAISHRGPDDRGYFFSEGGEVALAHNRLSIIDLSGAGHQPMKSADGETVLTYNGEIYNFLDLRRELEALGHRFHSRTDTEIVLNAYLQWGGSCVERFCGMFAFAIWSVRERLLFLARDPMGMKPLYYMELPNGKGFVFASEIKAFLAIPGFRPEIDRSSVRQFMEFGYTFDPRETILEGVFKLPPGHTLEVRKGVPGLPKPYFSLPSPSNQKAQDIAACESELYSTLSTVVKEHLVSDVPVGLLLSGGLDSSIIAAISSRHSRVTTINMAFSSSNVDESAYARTVSEHIKSDHHEIRISPEEVMSSLDDVVWYFDDLFADWGTFSTRLMYRKCREMGIKVVLVGEGSDELFGGYPVFDAGIASRGPFFLKFFMLYRQYCGRRYGMLFPRFYSVMKKYMEESNGDIFHALRLFECRNQLPNNYVMKVDKASMSVGVEARTPFLDRRITEIACKMPRSLLMREGTNKYLLRSMARRYDLLPEKIISRPKFGASIAASWMDDHEDFRQFARETILDPSGWVDELNLRKEMTDFFLRRSEGYAFPSAISIFRNTAWRLLLLNMWSRKYLDSWSGDILPVNESAIIKGLVSTIIPVFNRPEMLAEAVNSVLSQSYRPIEIIIVDDGSTDETARVADNLSIAQPDIVRVIHKENGGPGLAREVGRLAARGEFIQYLDSDDLLLPRKFELQVKGLNDNRDCGVSYGKLRYYKVGAPPQDIAWKRTGEKIDTMFPAFLKSRWWCTPTPLYRREVVDMAGPWTELINEEDWEYDCRIASRGVKLHYVPEFISEQREHSGDRLSSDGASNPDKLRARAKAHRLIYRHAVRAGITNEAPEMRHFARELFLLSRQCGAAGLAKESMDLFALSRVASERKRSEGLDFKIYKLCASVFGWPTIGRLACFVDRLIR